jgi:hypothetical protein
MPLTQNQTSSISPLSVHCFRCCNASLTGSGYPTSHIPHSTTPTASIPTHSKTNPADYIKPRLSFPPRIPSLQVRTRDLRIPSQLPFLEPNPPLASAIAIASASLQRSPHNSAPIAPADSSQQQWSTAQRSPPRSPQPQVLLPKLK